MESEERFDLAIGRIEQGNLQAPKHAGVAIRTADDSYFSLRLSMFPNVIYYLNKNAAQNGTYTVFSRLIKGTECTKFQNPVGFARLRPDLRTHMEIRFNLLERPLFMSLFPS